jgi:GDP-L-fucose synthase
MNDLDQKIYVAGHRGMAGSAIVRALKNKGYSNIIGRTHEELDLTNQLAVNNFFETEKPDQVYLAAARVGGIHANNTYPAEFIYVNLMIEANVINAAYKSSVKKLLFLGSSCIYPKLANQPMGEEALLSGYLEPTNEPYAIAKISGIKLCESYNRQYGMDYRCLMPTNLYGPGDNYHPENSHVIPALIKRFHDSKKNNSPIVRIWGSGLPMREFLYVEDMADAAIFLMNLDEKKFKSKIKPMQSHINAGYGKDISIRELAELIKKIVGYKGIIEFDSTKADGPLKKLTDIKLINKLGWNAKIDLEDGLIKTYNDFKMHQESLRT